jgi:hypothetical protein
MSCSLLIFNRYLLETCRLHLQDKQKFGQETSPKAIRKLGFLRRMPSSGMLGSVALVRTDVSEEHSASIIRLTRISELGATLAETDARCEEILCETGSVSIASYKNHNA